MKDQKYPVEPVYPPYSNEPIKKRVIDYTDEERALIEDFRQRKAAEEKKRNEDLHLIRVAADFLRWLTDNGRGASFSAFTDEFGYQNPEGTGRWSPSAFYERVMDLIKLAQKY